LLENSWRALLFIYSLPSEYASLILLYDTCHYDTAATAPVSNIFHYRWRSEERYADHIEREFTLFLMFIYRACLSLFDGFSL
jgi:hypothetical protein